MEKKENQTLLFEEPAVKYGRSQKGITKNDYLAFAALSGLNLSEFTSLMPVSKRTIEKVKGEDLLNTAVSDRVLRLMSLYDFGAEVLGDVQSFREWLNTPLIALGSQKPLSFMDKETGISMVSDLLGRIAYGVYS